MKRVRDHYTEKALKMGYPARSVFKLEEIDHKYHLLSPHIRVLDIGAAPGSWSMFVLKKIGKGSLVSVDLKELTIKPDKRLTCYRGDAFSPAMVEQITGHGPFHLILSDAAPSTTGNRLVDATRSLELVENVFHTYTDQLQTGGALVMKVFQGGAIDELTAEVKNRFARVKFFKPDASRKESFEVFLIAQNKK